MKAIIKFFDNNYWLCCSNCNHKIARILGNPQDVIVAGSSLEIKCTSCKELVYFDGECEIVQGYPTPSWKKIPR